MNISLTETKGSIYIGRLEFHCNGYLLQQSKLICQQCRALEQPQVPQVRLADHAWKHGIISDAHVVASGGTFFFYQHPKKRLCCMHQQEKYSQYPMTNVQSSKVKSLFSIEEIISSIFHVCNLNQHQSRCMENIYANNSRKKHGRLRKLDLKPGRLQKHGIFVETFRCIHRTDSQK